MQGQQGIGSQHKKMKEKIIEVRAFKRICRKVLTGVSLIHC